MSILVFGSINMDLVARAPHLPAPGETLTGSDFVTTPGGKGANQAVACARLGAVTRMIGAVGSDVFGDTLIRGLRENGVESDGVFVRPDTPSGVALITVSERGENTIVVIPGANGQLGEAELNYLQGAIGGATSLLLQLEVPMRCIERAAALAAAAGVRVILDPAPAQRLPESLYPHVAILTPNQTEAEILTGVRVETAADARQAARVLLDRGVRQVIIKMGGAGAFYASAQEEHMLPAIPVKVVDTVAAGDAFNGGLAVALDNGLPMAEALSWGLAAGAYAVTQPGAQSAMPTPADLQALLRRTA